MLSQRGSAVCAVRANDVSGPSGSSEGKVENPLQKGLQRSIASMKLTLVTHLSIEECQHLLADSRIFEGRRLRGDTLSGGALDRVNPIEFRVKWRWGPLHPFLFAATLARDGESTKIEGRLMPMPWFEAISVLPVAFPELFFLAPLLGLAVLLAIALRCCMSSLATWLLATVITITGIVLMIVAGKRLYRQAQDDVLRFLQDVAHAAPRQI